MRNRFEQLLIQSVIVVMPLLTVVCFWAFVQAWENYPQNRSQFSKSTSLITHFHAPQTRGDRLPASGTMPAGTPTSNVETYNHSFEKWVKAGMQPETTR